MNTDRIYVQIAECADRLERADMQLHDLHSTQYFLADAMGQYGDDCSRVFSLLSSVVEDIRAAVGEALGCACKARGYLKPETEAESA